MRVIIAGSRTITNYQYLLDAIKDSGFEITEIVCGMAKGVDLMGLRYGYDNGIKVSEFPANWNLGKSAGYKRNQEMAENADALIAIYDGSSKGTAHMIAISKSKNLKVFIKEIKSDTSAKSWITNNKTQYLVLALGLWFIANVLYICFLRIEKSLILTSILWTALTLLTSCAVGLLTQEQMGVRQIIALLFLIIAVILTSY